ncbi:MAG TPA: hypothetical protein VHV10_09035, partial [Ktedonobacteraceae bacterium]|nr:hypothetical protein [Ktedonobacteraceae bacterium]
MSSASIIIAQVFRQFPGSSPELPPILNSLKLLLNPSYTASKSDVKYSATVATLFDNVGTFSNTQASGLFLQLAGNTRYWDDNQTDNELSGQTCYGGGASGVGSGAGSATTSHYVNTKKLSIKVGTNMEARSRMDYAGQVQNFTKEFDVYIDNGNTEVGCVYRTTNWSNYNDNHAYSTGVQGTTIRLGRGSNSTASSNGTYTPIATATIALTSQEIHRYKVVVSGSSHKVYVDDILYINATDSTYSAAGYCGLRVVNFSGTDGYISFFDNFGIMKALSGTWTSNNISLSGAGSYGGSALFWEDDSLDSQSTDVLVETSVNGGSSYQTAVNGGAIANLTLGQSLSGVNLKIKVTLTTATASSMPQLRYLVARILGAFSSTGTRVAPVLDLSPAGTVGSTLVSWDPITPASTSVAVATSPNGSSYTSVSNGDPIAGIATPFAPTIDTFDTNTSSS